MRKLLSIAIPSYNSQDYMRNCIGSLLPGGDEVEILIVDDGSKDNTGAIADEYEQKYPGIVRAIHQENGGHGEAVNTGLRNATGFFYKVVDSDDWVDPLAYREILDFLRTAVQEEEPLDMLISNYVYEKVGASTKKVIHYQGIMPVNQYFTWKDTGHFGPSKNILMHSVIYRTDLLKSFSFELPKHTFYVDNIFVFWPLPYVKKMYYLDVDFYRYYIGRDDQSVNETVMISRIDQQIRVNKIMIDIFRNHERSFRSKKLRNYMLHYLNTICLVTSVLLMRRGDPEAMEMKNDLWSYLNDRSPYASRKIRSSMTGRLASSTSRVIRVLTLAGYKIAQKWIGFN